MIDSWVYMIGTDVLQVGKEDNPVVYNIIELQKEDAMQSHAVSDVPRNNYLRGMNFLVLQKY